MLTERSVEIDRPIQEVFDYTCNHVAEWSMIVIKEKVIDEKPEGIGTTFKTTTEENGEQMEFDGVVTRHETPTAQAATLTGKKIRHLRRVFF